MQSVCAGFRAVNKIFKFIAGEIFCYFLGQTGSFRPQCERFRSFFEFAFALRRFKPQLRDAHGKFFYIRANAFILYRRAVKRAGGIALTAVKGIGFIVGNSRAAFDENVIAAYKVAKSGKFAFVSWQNGGAVQNFEFSVLCRVAEYAETASPP